MNGITAAPRAGQKVDQQPQMSPELDAFYSKLRHVNRRRPSARLPRKGDRRRAVQRTGASS